MRKSVFLTLLVTLFSVAIVEVKGAEQNSKAGDYLPQAGDYIMLQNRRYETWLGIHSWGMLYGAEKTIDLDPDLIWELQEVASAEGGYNLYNVGCKKYANPLPEWDKSYCYVTDSKENAGKYQLLLMNGGVYAICDTQLEVENNCIYHSDWYEEEIIRNNRNEEASHWIISEVCPLNVI